MPKIRNAILYMGNSFRSGRRYVAESVTPYSVTSLTSTPIRSGTTEFAWGTSGDKKHPLNFLGSKCHNLKTSEQFALTFNQLTCDDVANIRDLFEGIEVTLPQTIQALHFYTAINCRFSDIFFFEFTRCKYFFRDRSEMSVGSFMEKHGKASLIVHLVIVKNLEDVAFVDQVLNAIASSHVFLSKLSTSIQKHDEILFKFLKHEFSAHKPKATIKSLRKYFKIITSRVQILIESKVLEKNMSDMKEGMRFLKNIQFTYLQQTMCGSVKELFRSDSTYSCPQSVMIPFKSRTNTLGASSSSTIGSFY